jgi:LysM repeat protein
VRFLAPAVFLLAVTGVVLLVRSSLRSDAPAARSTTAAETTTVSPARHPAPPRVAAQYYVIQSGDTLGAIAGRFGTTVDRLLLLNPGTEPAALTPGERLRIK